MNRLRVLCCLAIIAAPLLLPVAAQAQQAWIVDILANPSRNWNRTVVLVGQVQNVVANPAGTTRGTYTLLDESCPNPIVVRTNDLPPVGKTYSVTGIVIQDPTSAAPILKEVSRTTPGMTSNMLYLLVGAGVLFLGLLIVFIVLLVKPKAGGTTPVETVRPRTQETVRPTVRAAPAPMPSPAGDPLKTAKMPAGGPPVAAPGAKTQVFMSLGADLVVERGPDRGREFPLHKQVTTIGRPGVRQNDVEVTDETVSKEQAAIYYDPSRKTFSIANESTTNPTKVNSHPVSGPVLLEQGALIELGKTVLRFRIN